MFWTPQPPPRAQVRDRRRCPAPPGSCHQSCLQTWVWRPRNSSPQSHRGQYSDTCEWHSTYLSYRKIPNPLRDSIQHSSPSDTIPPLNLPVLFLGSIITKRHHRQMSISQYGALFEAMTEQYMKYPDSRYSFLKFYSPWNNHFKTDYM